MSHSTIAVLQDRPESMIKQHRAEFLCPSRQNHRGLLLLLPDTVVMERTHVALHEDFIAKATMAILRREKFEI